MIPHSQIFQITWAFVLLPVQFSYVFQPFYLGSTSVNYHFHLTDAQYNITELAVTLIAIGTNLPPPPEGDSMEQKDDKSLVFW
jgi:hypothetical protein